jgi:hypothetical protein
VIRAMIAEPAPPPAQGGPQTADPRGEGAPLPDAPPDLPPSPPVLADGGGGCVVFEPPIPPFYEPPYPSWLWDPNWYQPTLDANGGTNPAQHHPDTPPAVLDTTQAAVAQALGVRPPRERNARENDARERPDFGSQERDSGRSSRPETSRRY